MKESDIQTQIVQWMSFVSRRFGFLFFSVPNEATVRGSTGKDFGRTIQLKKTGVTSGVSDLVIGCRGRMYCLEVKTTTGKQSDNQVLFEKWCADCGIPYRVVRSLDEAVSVMREWEIING